MAADNHTLAPECIAHSDRGSNYTSHAYAEVLARLDLKQSLGRRGTLCVPSALADGDRVGPSAGSNQRRTPDDNAVSV
jgi:putative transposase